MSELSSPFAKPMPGIPIREGAPPVSRPTPEEIEAFPAEARALMDRHWGTQQALLATDTYDFDWLKGRHFFLAGATGPGIGGALALPLLKLLGDSGSLTVLGRDLSRSINFETGRLMETEAEAAGFGQRFHWINGPMELEGKNFDKIVEALQEAGADHIIYINTVAAAISGLLPNMPPVFVKDVDDSGLFQWQLTPLDERSIDITRYVMGELAVQFPKALAKAGIKVDVAVFADWRGSLDKAGQDPKRKEYGRQGAYSTSLYLPKLVLQEAVAANYGSKEMIMMDIFYPVMRTRALPFIPGGMAMANIFDRLMVKEGVQRVGRAQLALNTLQVIGRALTEGYDNPFPRLDKHESPLDEWFFEVLLRINDDEESDFYYKRWLE